MNFLHFAEFNLIRKLVIDLAFNYVVFPKKFCQHPKILLLELKYVYRFFIIKMNLN